MAKIACQFIFEINDQFKRLTMHKMSPKKPINSYGKLMSKQVSIPLDHMLLRPEKSMKPIGLLKNITLSVSELVDQNGTSYYLENMMNEKIQVEFWTKHEIKNRWNTSHQKIDREQTLQGILPELLEWSGISPENLKIKTFEDENSMQIAPEDYKLFIPQLIQKYGDCFELLGKKMW